MDSSELPDYRQCFRSDQDTGRLDKVSKTKSKSYHPTYHPLNKHNALTSLSEPIITDYTRGKLLNGNYQIQHVNSPSVNPENQFPDRTSGNSLFAGRKVGPLHRKYCDTKNAHSVYGSEDIGISNKKFTSSENSSSRTCQNGAKNLGTLKKNSIMVSHPEIRILNESYVTSALTAENDNHLQSSSKSTKKSNGMEKVGQVSAGLPLAGSSTIATSWKNYHLGITNSTSEQNGNKSNHKNAFNNDESHQDIGGREISMKLNKALEKYDGLDKLKEKIKRQQQAFKENKKPEKTNAKEVKTVTIDQSCMTDVQSSTNGSNDGRYLSMMEEEPYTPVRKSSHRFGKNRVDNEEDERHIKVRKISTSVAPPSYKGFTDLKGKPCDKSSNATNKYKTKFKENKTNAKINDKVSSSSTTLTSSDISDSKKMSTESMNDKIKSHHKDMITASSWRKGQETIRRLLGPPQKSPTAKPKSFLANQEEVNLEERKLTFGARQMLQDLQLNKNIEANNATSLEEENEKITSETKPEHNPEISSTPHAVKRKPTKVIESEKQAKVRHYDPEEVRKFIAKKKDERSRKAREEKMALINSCAKRQEMLQEVYRKQKEATAALQKEGISSKCKSRNVFEKSTKERSAFNVELSVGGSSELHLSFGDTSSTLTTHSVEGSTPLRTPRAESAPVVLPLKSKSITGRSNDNATYPRSFSENFELNSASRKSHHPTLNASSVDILSSTPKSDPASYLGQIEMSNRRRIMDIHSSAATLTNKLREIYRQTSASDIISQPEDCYSPPLDILNSAGPTYIGTLLDNNLPGVQSLRLKAQEIYEKKEQDAATRIQAVYRGYTVRKNLKWRYLTGRPDIEDQVTSSFKSNSRHEQSDISSIDCGLAGNSFNLGKTSKFKSLFRHHLTDHHKDNENLTYYANQVKESKPKSRSSTLYPKYPWENAASDQFSIVNIFTSKYKDLIQTEDPLSDVAPNVENHVAKLHSPITSPVSSTGTNKKKHTQDLSGNLQHSVNTGLKSNLSKPVKTNIDMESKGDEVSIQLEEKTEVLLDVKELCSVSSEKNGSSYIGGTRSKSSHKTSSRKGTSARKKLDLYQASSKSAHTDSHTDTSFQSFSGDSEVENRSTSEARQRSHSSIGDSTDSDISSLLNEHTKIHFNPSQSKLSSSSHPLGKNVAGSTVVHKRYAPSTLPMRLRAELYNFEQTVETVSLAQQETFSLGQIFQNQEQKLDQELHYWDHLKHAVNLLDAKTPGQMSKRAEHSEALMSGDQSFSLKSITANEENTLAIPSATEGVSNSNKSESLYSHSHTKQLQSQSASRKYSTMSTSQTESKRLSHRKNLPKSSHDKSHCSDESSSGGSSKYSVKTASDVRAGEETSDSITEDISDGSNIESSHISSPSFKQSEHSNKSTSTKETWKVQLEEEKQRAQREDAIWQGKLKEVQEKLNSLQHPLVKKELDEVLPDLVKKKLVALEQVPQMMAELQQLTDKQESSRREHYKRVKSLLKSQAKSSERNSQSSKDSCKSDSEIYHNSKRTKEHGSSSEYNSMVDMHPLKEKCLAEKKLEVKALEKRLQHEEKYLRKLKKETIKKCGETNTRSLSSNSNIVTDSIKEELSSQREKQNSKRRIEKFSQSNDHSISEASTVASISLPVPLYPSLDKNHSIVSGGAVGGSGAIKSSISEDIQEKISSASNGSKSKKQYSSVNENESSVAEDINSNTRNDNSHTRNDNSSYKKNRPVGCESGDETATNDEYSRSFETSISSSYRASPVRQLPKPLVGTRNGSLSFKSSRSSRCRVRGSESDTEDSFQSETLSDASDIEVRIRALSEDLKKKKIEADRLRHEKKAKYREKLKAQEESLIKQIEAYDNYIEQIKDELQKEQDISNKKSVKPQIKQPKVSESRKFKQKPTPDASPTQLNKRDSTGSSADETFPTSPLSPVKHESQAESSICSGTLSPRLQAATKIDISRQSTSPIASHSIQQSSHKDELQQSSHKDEPHTATTEIKTKSITEELDEKTSSSTKSVSVNSLSKMNNESLAPSSALSKSRDTDEKSILKSNLSEKTSLSTQSVSVNSLSKMNNTKEPLSSSPKNTVNSALKADSLAESASIKSLQSSAKTSEKSPQNEGEEQVDSEPLPSDKSVHVASHLDDISEKISEKIESLVSSSALSKSRDTDEKSVLKLNLSEGFSSHKSVSSDSKTKESVHSSKTKEKPADANPFSEHYSEDFEVDKTISSQHSLTFDDYFEDNDNDSVDGFDDHHNKNKDNEISQCLVEKTVPEAEPEDEISEQISIHSDNSARTSSNSLAIPRGVPDGQLDETSQNSSLHANQVLSSSEFQAPHKEPSEEFNDSWSQENTASVHTEQAQVPDSGNVVAKNTPQQIENVVDDILNQFVSESVSTICKIAAGKKETMASAKSASPPPVLAKPKRKTSPEKRESVADSVLTSAVDIEEPASSSTVLSSTAILKESETEEASEEKSQRITQKISNELMESLLSESIKKMLDTRKRKINHALSVSPVQSPQEIIIDERKVTKRKSSSFDLPAFSLDDDPFLWSLSPDSESSDDFQVADCNDFDKSIPRPHSPLPNEPKASLLSDDINTSDNIWPDLLSFKPPPPYPGQEADTLELEKLSKEFYAVPQKREEINELVSNAVGTFWQDRINGQPLSETTMPDCFVTVTDDLVSEMDQQSCRSYKKMLFDLTREIIEEVYQANNNSQNNDGKTYSCSSSNPISGLIHRKCQPVINKYYRQSRSPPSSPEELQKVVQDAVASLLQLDDDAETGGRLAGCTTDNGGRRQEFDKWKTSKKDHVDRILIQELQEEEPQWVDYDADVYELKVRLTNTIFDSLIAQTVETFRNIYNRRNQRQQQQQQQIL